MPNTPQPDAPYVSRCPDRGHSELLGVFTSYPSRAKLDHLKQELEMNYRNPGKEHEYVIAVKLLTYYPEEWESIMLRAVRPWEREHPGLEIELAWTNERPTNNFIETYRQKVQQALATLPSD